MADQAFPGSEAYPNYIANMRRSSNLEHAWTIDIPSEHEETNRRIGAYLNRSADRNSQLAKEAGIDDIGSK